ncbi:hypothetical protein B0H16DRAFT_1780814 [Mycena metata]|uniref:Uncharacterized protein n=1 Tax=Mycena metata TaxID=1033252 RepID=A0AAD7JNW1_9AGAR|nr:hypothetical protein B0H16DRAFT_1780814 [Mycena metata]
MRLTEEIEDRRRKQMHTAQPSVKPQRDHTRNVWATETVFNIFTSPTVPIKNGGAPSRLMSGAQLSPIKGGGAPSRLNTAISSRQTRRRVRTGAENGGKFLKKIPATQGFLLLSAKPSHPARADVIDVRHRRHQGRRRHPSSRTTAPKMNAKVPDAHPMCSYYPLYRATCPEGELGNKGKSQWTPHICHKYLGTPFITPFMEEIKGFNLTGY